MRKPLYVAIIVLILCLFASINKVEAENHQETDRKVILISFDGMKNDYTQKYVKEGKLPHIKQLLENGVSAKVRYDDYSFSYSTCTCSHGHRG